MFPSGGTNHVSVGLGLSYTHVLNAPSRRLWFNVPGDERGPAFPWVSRAGCIGIPQSNGSDGEHSLQPRRPHAATSMSTCHWVDQASQRQQKRQPASSHAPLFRLPGDSRAGSVAHCPTRSMSPDPRSSFLCVRSATHTHPVTLRRHWAVVCSIGTPDTKCS